MASTSGRPEVQGCFTFNSRLRRSVTRLVSSSLHEVTKGFADSTEKVLIRELKKELAFSLKQRRIADKRLRDKDAYISKLKSQHALQVSKLEVRINFLQKSCEDYTNRIAKMTRDFDRLKEKNAGLLSSIAQIKERHTSNLIEQSRQCQLIKDRFKDKNERLYEWVSHERKKLYQTLEAFERKNFVQKGILPLYREKLNEGLNILVGLPPDSCEYDVYAAARKKTRSEELVPSELAERDYGDVPDFFHPHKVDAPVNQALDETTSKKSPKIYKDEPSFWETGSVSSSYEMPMPGKEIVKNLQELMSIHGLSASTKSSRPQLVTMNKWGLEDLFYKLTNKERLRSFVADLCNDMGYRRESKPNRLKIALDKLAKFKSANSAVGGAELSFLNDLCSENLFFTASY